MIVILLAFSGIAPICVCLALEAGDFPLAVMTAIMWIESRIKIKDLSENSTCVRKAGEEPQP